MHQILLCDAYNIQFFKPYAVDSILSHFEGVSIGDSVIVSTSNILTSGNAPPAPSVVCPQHYILFNIPLGALFYFIFQFQEIIPLNLPN